MYQPVVVESPRARPGSVSAAGYLLFLVALTEVVSAIIGLSVFGKESDALVAAVKKSAADQNKTISDPTSLVHTLIYAQVVIAIIIAVLFVLMGVFVLRGRQGMRITAWVITGLGVLCSGIGLAGEGLAGSAAGADSSTTVDLPSWLTTTQRSLSVIDLLAFLAIIVLLALPASNPYFKKPMMAEPPLPYPGQIHPG